MWGSLRLAPIMSFTYSMDNQEMIFSRNNISLERGIVLRILCPFTSTSSILRYGFQPTCSANVSDHYFSIWVET